MEPELKPIHPYKVLELNNRQEDDYALLLQLKETIAKQLSSMTKEYITKIIFQAESSSVVLIDENKEILGGACYRFFQNKEFAQLVFLAVNPKEQAKGWGRNTLTELKEILMRKQKKSIITYADNYACQFFKKQGFTNGVTLEKWKWEGFIKQYNNGTLMEYIINKNINFRDNSTVREQKSQLIMKLKNIKTSFFAFDEQKYKRELQKQKEKFIKNNPEKVKYRKGKYDVPSDMGNTFIKKNQILNRLECAALLKLLENHENAFLLKNISSIKVPKGMSEIIVGKISLYTLRQGFQSGQYTKSLTMCSDIRSLISNSKYLYPLYTVYHQKCVELERFMTPYLQSINLGTFNAIQILRDENRMMN